MTYTYPTKTYKKCHTGNVLITAVGKGGLYAGGWSREAGYMDITIDLTGSEKLPTIPSKATTDVKQTGVPLFDKLIEKKQKEADEELEARRKAVEKASWLTLPCKDYGIPVYDREDFDLLVGILMPEMKKGKKVTVCCTGGHGRTGTVVSILSWLIRAKLKELQPDNPVTWLRKYYCEEGVETQAQEQYVYDILGLDITAKPHEKPKSVAGNVYAYCPTCKANKPHTSYKDKECIECEIAAAPLFLPPTTNPNLACDNCGKKDDTSAVYTLCTKCQAAMLALMQQAEKEGHSRHYYLAKDGKCVVCKLELVKYDDNGIKTGICHGVDLGKCGHVVHNQQFTRPDAPCDACYSDKYYKEKEDVGASEII